MIINENFGLNWKGKSEAIKEISKKTKSKFQVITDKKYINENSKNIFIEGDNLDALKLMQKEYRQKIKMIYIDPPYNTGNNFIYSDDFSNKKKLTNKEYKNTDIEELINQNNINSASFHSDWLSMMLPRLYLSKNLLKPDGIIFISIDHRENATL
ncbi:MAG: site-specific DNA-methyltransferase, partial [Bacteroidales bacterium]|nr:site-specific DNA-methyltransferase [Bacteroidales bacterium]